MGCSRRLMSSQFSVMLRLLSSFSPTVASSMSSVAVLGITLSLSLSLNIYMCVFMYIWYMFVCVYFSTLDFVCLMGVCDLFFCKICGLYEVRHCHGAAWWYYGYLSFSSPRPYLFFWFYWIDWLRFWSVFLCQLWLILHSSESWVFYDFLSWRSKLFLFHILSSLVL